MDSEKLCLRTLILYEFKKGVKAAACARHINEKFGSEVISEGTCRNWYKKFRSGNFVMRDKDRSGRPSKIDNNVLKKLVEENPHLTTRDLAEILNVSHTAVLNHLHQLNMISKLDVWVPQES